MVAVEDDWDESTAKFSSVVHTPILDFLASKASLTDLGGRAKDRIEELRQLPIFLLASGALTSLDRDDVFLANDFEVPPLRIEHGVLDSGKDGKWKPLYDQLGIQRLSKNRLIKSVVVPRYSSLTKDDQLTALRWMRTHLQPALDELENEPEEARKTFGDFLRISKLIHSSDGMLRAPEDVYPPDASFVQGLLGELAGFPDMSTYRDDPGRWLAFFRELGAPQAISARALLRGVDRVIEDSQSNSTESTKTLQRLADYLEGHWPDLRDQRIDDDRLRTKQPWTLLESLEVRAWLPALQEPPVTYPLALFESPSKHLFKPGELYVRESLELVGTSCPVCSIPRLVSLRDDLGITQYPDLKLVLEHFEHVLEYYQKSECSEENRKAAHRVIERIYRFFGSRFGSRETVTPKEDQEAHAIKSWGVDRRCILDAEGRLWRPSDVFREATAFFLGLRGQARSKSDDVDHGLEVLGRRESPEAFDFREFFDELTRIQSGRSVEPDQLDQIREAYNRASNLDDSQSSLRGAQVLSDALVLAEHTDIVLDDAPWWNERAKRAGICFLDHKLQPAVADAFGVASLSKALSEEIVEASDTTCSQFQDRCSVLQRRIRSNEFGCGLLRILRSQCLTADAQGLDWLKEARIRPVDRLITTLCWVDESEDISGSEGESDVLIHPTENALVVSVLASDILYQRVAAVIQQELAKKDVRLADLTPLVSILGEEPGGIDTLLDRLRVPKLLQSNLATIPTDTENEQFIDSEEVAEKLTESASAATRQGVGATQDSEQIIHSCKSGPPTKTANEQSSGGTYRPVENQVDVGSQDRGATVADSNNANAHEEQRTVRAGNPNASDEDHQQLSHVAKPPAGSSSSSGFPERGAVSEDSRRQQDTGGALHGAAGGTKGAGERDQGQSELAKGPPASNKSRSSAGSSKGQRARTYVENRKDGKDQGGAKNDSSKRTDVERAAVERVLAYERQRGRLPKEMSHTNPGYDIESRPPRGEIERYIEVKGLAGAWTDWGVGLSPEQIRHGQREGMRFWLYVVEFALEPARSKIFAIQDPYALIDEFRFDDGWKLLGKERDGPGTGALPTVGATIVLGTGKKGTIRGVRKQGAFFQLNIKLEGEDQPYNCVYQPATMQIVSVEEPK
jgi:hypothetical protein